MAEGVSIELTSWGCAMRDAGARENLRRLAHGADDRTLAAIAQALRIAGSKAAASYCQQIKRQRVAMQLLSEQRQPTEVEQAVMERFGVSRSTAWRDTLEAVSSIAAQRNNAVGFSGPSTQPGAPIWMTSHDAKT